MNSRQARYEPRIRVMHLAAYREAGFVPSLPPY